MKTLVLCNSRDEGLAFKLRMTKAGTWPEGAKLVWEPSQLVGVPVWEYRFRETPLACASRLYPTLKAELYARRRLGKKGLKLTDARDKL